MNWGWRSLVSSLAACALVSGVALSSSARAEPVKIRVGWIVMPASLAPVLYEKKDLLKHYGTSYTVEPMHFQGTPLAITALATGEVDITTLAFSSFATAVVNAKMDDLRVVADELQDGVGDYYSNQFTILKDGGIKTVDDLKGKVLATNGAGSAVDMALRFMLRTHHLEDKHDVTIIEAGIPVMNAMLAARKVDLITSVLPFSEDPTLLQSGRVLFTQKDAVGTTQFALSAARADFLAKNHDALVDFYEDTIRAQRWFLDPAHHAEAVAIIAASAKQPPALFDKWLFTHRDYYRDPNDLPNVEALQKNTDMQQELGFLAQKIDVAKYVDLGIVKAAAKRLD